MSKYLLVMKYLDFIFSLSAALVSPSHQLSESSLSYFIVSLLINLYSVPNYEAK
jgi:hypothetical protein